MRNGPATVGISVNRAFFNFKGPIYDGECLNASSNLNHAVLLYGWDEKYWFIKNSWGTGWGQNGHAKLARGQNKCGINFLIDVPIIKV